jgi:hypothetical protein
VRRSLLCNCFHLLAVSDAISEEWFERSNRKTVWLAKFW